MSQHDTSYYLWEVLFRCRIPQLQTTDLEYLKFFGYHTTGNDAIDKELANQWIDTMIPIHQMVDYHKRNIPIRIVYEQDLEKIYHYIENHLQAWTQTLQKGLNISDAPIEDLVAMNSFANTLYPVAKPLFKERMIESSFLRSIRQSQLQSSPMKSLEKISQERVQERKHEQRSDLASIFKNIRNGGVSLNQ